MWTISFCERLCGVCILPCLSLSGWCSPVHWVCAAAGWQSLPRPRFAPARPVSLPVAELFPSPPVQINMSDEQFSHRPHKNTRELHLTFSVPLRITCLCFRLLSTIIRWGLPVYPSVYLTISKCLWERLTSCLDSWSCCSSSVIRALSSSTFASTRTRSSSRYPSSKRAMLPDPRESSAWIQFTHSLSFMFIYTIAQKYFFILLLKSLKLTKAVYLIKIQQKQ